jgi:outer membrane receptor protein involved in Fe transport
MELGGAVNVGDGYSRGVEAELNALLTDRLSLRVGYTYDLTKLTSISALALENLTSPPIVGTQLPGTPKNSASVSMEYGHIPVAGGELRFLVDGHYQSSVVTREYAQRYSAIVSRPRTVGLTIGYWLKGY